MKRIIIGCIVVAFACLTAIAKEEAPANSIVVETYSLHGHKFAHAGMHATRQLEIRVEHGAQLDIIPVGNNGTWVAEARSPKDQVKITIQVYDDNGKLVASAEAEGGKLVGTITQDKPTVTCLDDKKD